jgi:hypothetical protein
MSHRSMRSTGPPAINARAANHVDQAAADLANS